MQQAVPPRSAPPKPKAAEAPPKDAPLAAEAELQARFAELARLGALLTEAEARLLDERRRYETLLAESAGRLAESQRQLQQAQAEAAALKASTSWRLTAPLRALSRRLRRLLRRG